MISHKITSLSQILDLLDDSLSYDYRKLITKSARYRSEPKTVQTATSVAASRYGHRLLHRWDD